jgi:MoxR-like ATPase
MPHDPANAAQLLRGALATACHGLVERESLVELIALSAVAGEHLLVIGPPGTAKSEAVRRISRALGGRYFEYLLGRFTEPSEIFGPIDLRKLREGVLLTETSGMLPEAELAFLDEVFLGSTAILNTLLGILHDRRFQRGHTRIVCPLRVCVGASNALPDDLSLAAFADRFLVRVFVEPIPGPRLEELLERGWYLAGHESQRTASVEHIDLLASTSRAMDLGAVRPLIAHAVRRLRSAGIELSDRRVVKLQGLVAAAAALAGRSAPTEADLWPLVFAVPTSELQSRARDVLRDLLERSESPTLPAAAAEASLGPLARAGRIASAGAEVLAARPSDGSGPRDLELWRLKLESLGREIDAGFSAEQMPEELRTLRERIVSELGARP